MPKAPDQPFSLLASAHVSKWHENNGKLDERPPVQKIPSPFRSKAQGARGARAASASPGGPASARRGGSLGGSVAGPSPITPRVGRQSSGGGYAQRALAAGVFAGAAGSGAAGGEGGEGGAGNRAAAAPMSA